MAEKGDRRLVSDKIPQIEMISTATSSNEGDPTRFITRKKMKTNTEAKKNALLLKKIAS